MLELIVIKLRSSKIFLLIAITSVSWFYKHNSHFAANSCAVSLPSYVLTRTCVCEARDLYCAWENSCIVDVGLNIFFWDSTTFFGYTLLFFLLSFISFIIASRDEKNKSFFFVFLTFSLLPSVLIFFIYFYLFRRVHQILMKEHQVKKIFFIKIHTMASPKFYRCVNHPKYCSKYCLTTFMTLI